MASKRHKNDFNMNLIMCFLCIFAAKLSWFQIHEKCGSISFRKPETEMSIRGVILAGGKGTRMGELTKVTHKQVTGVSNGNTVPGIT
jgi:hypothetical protein